MKSVLFILFIVCISLPKGKCTGNEDSTNIDTIHHHFISFNVAPLFNMNVSGNSSEQWGLSYIYDLKNGLEIEAAVNFFNFKEGQNGHSFWIKNDSTMSERREWLKPPKFAMIQGGINYSKPSSKFTMYAGLHFYLGYFRIKGGMFEYDYFLDPVSGWNANDHGPELAYRSLYFSTINCLVYGLNLKVGITAKIQDNLIIRIGCEPYFGWYQKDSQYTYTNNFNPDDYLLDIHPGYFYTSLLNNISLMILLK